MWRVKAHNPAVASIARLLQLTAEHLAPLTGICDQVSTANQH